MNDQYGSEGNGLLSDSLDEIPCLSRCKGAHDQS